MTKNRRKSSRKRNQSRGKKARPQYPCLKSWHLGPNRAARQVIVARARKSQGSLNRDEARKKRNRLIVKLRRKLRIIQKESRRELRRLTEKP